MLTRVFCNAEQRGTQITVTVKGHSLTQYQKYIFVQIMCST